MKHDTAQPRIASYVIFRKDNKIALLLRSNTSWMNGYYTFPAGKVEKNETYVQCAIREAKEEVGADIAEDNLRHVFTMHRQEHDTSENTWVDVFFEVSDYQGELHNAEPHMHSELMWVEISEVPENILPFAKAALDFMAEGKQFSEWGWSK